MKRSMQLLIGLVAVGSVAVGACSSAQDTSNTSAASDAPTSGSSTADSAQAQPYAGQTITFVAGEQPWSVGVKALLPEFEAQTGITVNLQLLAEDQARDKTLVSLQSKSNNLDVYMTLPSREGRQFAQAGYYEDLQSYLDDASKTPSDFDFADFGEATRNGMKIDDQMIGLPLNVEGPVLYYRKDILDKYGLGVPATLDDLVTAAKTIQEDSSAGMFGLAVRGLAPSVAYDFSNFLHNSGGEWVDSAGKPALESDAGKAALQTYTDILKDYGPTGGVNNSFAQNTPLYASGAVAMYIDSSDESSVILDPDQSTVADKTGIIPVPAGAGGSHPTILSWGLAMSPYSGAKDAAWAFMTWATSKAVQAKLAASGVASPRSSVSADPEYQASLDTQGRKDWQAAIDAILSDGNPNVGPPAVDQSKARTLIGDEIGKVVLGQQSVDDAASNIDKGLADLVG